LSLSHRLGQPSKVASIDRELKGELRCILLDLDETLYSREEAFWSWIEIQVRSTRTTHELDRQKVAELDQRGRGDKVALLEYLDSVFAWRQTQPERLEPFRRGIGAEVRLASGVMESLTRAGQYRLGLVSNGTSSTQRTKLKALPVEDLGGIRSRGRTAVRSTVSNGLLGRSFRDDVDAAFLRANGTRGM
jgi:Haloacid dehalogenase-like hydrolase